MQLITYKTNISNETSLQKVAPILNKVVGSPNWQLDLESQNRELKVFAYSFIETDTIIKAIRKAGFRAENLEEYQAIY